MVDLIVFGILSFAMIFRRVRIYIIISNTRHTFPTIPSATVTAYLHFFRKFLEQEHGGGEFRIWIGRSAVKRLVNGFIE